MLHATVHGDSGDTYDQHVGKHALTLEMGAFFFLLISFATPPPKGALANSFPWSLLAVAGAVCSIVAGASPQPPRWGRRPAVPRRAAQRRPRPR